MDQQTRARRAGAVETGDHKTIGEIDATRRAEAAAADRRRAAVLAKLTLDLDKIMAALTPGLDRVQRAGELFGRTVTDGTPPAELLTRITDLRRYLDGPWRTVVADAERAAHGV